MKEKVAAFNFVPKFCPICGAETSVGDVMIAYPVMEEYLSGKSCTCPGCGLCYQLASRKEIIRAASSYGGDMEKKANG